MQKSFKLISIIFIVLICFLTPSYSSISEKDLDLEKCTNDPIGNEYTAIQCVEKKHDINGKKTYSLITSRVDRVLFEVLFPHVGNYPPKFDSKNQQKRIRCELIRIIYLIELFLKNNPESQDLLWRTGFAYSMAYNLDIPQSAENVEKKFKKLFQIDPEHAEGNYRYGMFLSMTYTEVKRSIPYLERSVQNGYIDALFTLGYVYLRIKEREKALKYLNMYLEANPDDKNTQTIIRAIKAGNINYQYIDKEQP